MIEGAELIEVESVVAEGDQILSIQFNNGQKKKVDLSVLLKNPPPVFAVLREANEFKKASQRSQSMAAIQPVPAAVIAVD